MALCCFQHPAPSSGPRCGLDLALPWQLLPGNFHMPQVQPEKEKKRAAKIIGPSVSYSDAQLKIATTPPHTGASDHLYLL